MGNVRTAIYNYLYAKQHGGEMIFRIEDTDKERSKKEYEIELIQNLKWLGISWDNDEVVHQSERGDVYSRYLEKMIADGFAYVSKEETGGDPTKRAEVVRFKNLNKKISFTDLIRGEITFDTTELKDFVIAKSMTEPIYHLAVVIDDHEAGVTHVIRGEDHISNTTRQILIGEAIGAQRPIYAHLPLILDKDRAKLSKRKHGEKVSLKYFKDLGYLPEAIVNYMAMLGWNPGTPKELFTMDELIKEFDITKVQKAGAIFNEEKLRWVNKEYLKRTTHIQLATAVRDYIDNSDKFKEKKWKMSDEILMKIIPIILDRINVYKDASDMANNGELDFLFEQPTYDAKDLLWRDETGKENTQRFLLECTEILKQANDDYFSDADRIKSLLWEYASINGKGSVLWPIRFALSGKMKSPDPFNLLSVIGKKEGIKRLEYAIEALKNDIN
jgi:glutamyl-tRNA synthetase